MTALLLTLLAAAPVPTLQVVTFPSGSEAAHGELAVPTTPGKHPALIVIHEWWGLNDWVRTKTRLFADEGIEALAVDLYRGQVATDPDTAHQLSRGLPEDRAARDLAGAFAYLAARPDVDATRIGVIGWCMGGGYSLQEALQEPRLRAGVIYYGRLVTDPTSIAKIKAPLLGNFGADDKGISPDSVKAFAAAAKQAGVQIDAKIYPGAGHGFASSPDPKTYKPDAAKDADARTDAFFGHWLLGH